MKDIENIHIILHYVGLINNIKHNMLKNSQLN